jgi:hypothetical protein
MEVNNNGNGKQMTHENTYRDDSITKSTNLHVYSSFPTLLTRR